MNALKRAVINRACREYGWKNAMDVACADVQDILDIRPDSAQAWAPPVSVPVVGEPDARAFALTRLGFSVTWREIL